MIHMYNQFIINSYKWVSGITIIDSWKPGKNVGIFAITHGNEPVWLGVFEHLSHWYRLGEKIKSGKIFLIAVNIEAYEKFIQDGNDNKYRFIHDNMNRISNKPFRDKSYEFRRFKELMPILDELDIAIDLHSVPIGDDIIGIVDQKYLTESLWFLDVETILVDDIKNTGALIGYLLRQEKEAYGLECCNHTDSQAFETGVRNVLNLLIFEGVIDGIISQKHSVPQVFEFIEEVQPLTGKFQYMAEYSWFTRILDDQIFARDGEIDRRNTLWDNIFLWLVMKDPKKWDGAGFLFRKIGV